MNQTAPNIEEIFYAALELDGPEARAAFLDRVCGDTELRRRVERLLAVDGRGNNFLESPASMPTVTADQNPGSDVEVPGTVIGPYKLMEVIGEGGMGVVYVAEQHQPVRRKVALKVIKPGMDSRQVVARFEAERQALAMMNHPNIAKVLDGGTTPPASSWLGSPGGSASPVSTPPGSPAWQGGAGQAGHSASRPSDGGSGERLATPPCDDWSRGRLAAPPCEGGGGRPYFVMELVRGLPITEYCDRERLPIRERLELFVLVCRAVQHAHQKGIIHRDLKPLNILVTLHDGVPVPKVIDFGVAKAIDGGLTEKTVYTAFAQLVGTPLYMSPEQVELSGLDVDTRSDIYSLGVLLYELLTGTTPFDSETLKQAAFDEMRRIIREDEPPRPSTRLSTLGEALTTTSARRSSDPRQLDHSVRGELDWIVMKALEKDRRRRYETASDFASDVMRYLTDRPVEACPPSAWYRFTKYARRNCAGLITAGLVSMALIAGTGVSIWQAVRATRSEQRATAALAESRLVVDYLVNDVFGAAAPEKTRGRTLTIHDLLAVGKTVIPARFGRRPLVEAAAREALGRAYYDLGRYDEAATRFRRVADLRARHLRPDHPETLAAQSLIIRALCPATIWGKPGEAEPLARRVLEARRRVLGPAHPQTLASMTALAHVLTEKWLQIINAESPRYPSVMVPDDVLRAKGTPAMSEALGLLEPALAGQVRTLGPTHIGTLETLSALGWALHYKGDFAGAVDAQRRAADGRSRMLGPAHPATLQSLKLLADSLRRFGRMDEANRLYLEVAEGHREIFGPNHPQTRSTLVRVFLTCRRAKDAATMREVCERWLREILKSPIDADPYQRSRRASQLNYLALNLTTLPAPIPFDTQLAAQAAEEAATIGGDWYGWTVLGAIHCRLGRLDEALQACQTAARQPNWAVGNDLHWFVLAVIHGRRGDLARAKECYERGRALDPWRDTWAENTDIFRTEAAALLNIKAKQE